MEKNEIHSLIASRGCVTLHASAPIQCSDDCYHELRPGCFVKWSDEIIKEGHWWAKNTDSIEVESVHVITEGFMKGDKVIRLKGPIESNWPGETMEVGLWLLKHTCPGINNINRTK